MFNCFFELLLSPFHSSFYLTDKNKYDLFNLNIVVTDWMQGHPFLAKN